VQLAAPILHLLMLDSDARGRVYVAGAIAHESPEPPYNLYDERITVVRIDGGQVRGSIDLPPITEADESIRPLSVDDDGNVYLMRGGDSGLEVRRYSF
jgi:hypothetical protein